MMRTFSLYKRWPVKEIAGFNGFAMDFEFGIRDSQGRDPQTVIFARKDKIFQFNYETGQITNLYSFKESL